MAYFVISIMAIIVAFFGSSDYVIYYSFLMLLVGFSLFSVVRIFSLENIINWGVNVYVLSIIFAVLLHGGDLISSLDPSANRWEVRFRPFGLHPNLTGYIYGAGILLMSYKIITSKKNFTKIYWAILFLMCFIFVFAAQARTGLIAALFACCVAGFVSYKYWSSRLKTVFFSLSLCAVAAVFIYLTEINYYLTEMLDLDSNTRGLDTGGTGRLVLWARAYNDFLDAGWRIFVGGGLRYSSAEIIGYSTESSYLTILLDSGLFGFILYMTALFGLLFKSWKKCYNFSGFDYAYFLVVVLFFFALIQSIANRYLFAIGNPFSLLFLLILFKISSDYLLDKDYGISAVK